MGPTCASEIQGPITLEGCELSFTSGKSRQGHSAASMVARCKRSAGPSTGYERLVNINLAEVRCLNPQSQGLSLSRLVARFPWHVSETR